MAWQTHPLMVSEVRCGGESETGKDVCSTKLVCMTTDKILEFERVWSMRQLLYYFTMQDS